MRAPREKIPLLLKGMRGVCYNVGSRALAARGVSTGAQSEYATAVLSAEPMAAASCVIHRTSEITRLSVDDVRVDLGANRQKKDRPEVRPWDENVAPSVDPEATGPLEADLCGSHGAPW